MSFSLFLNWKVDKSLTNLSLYTYFIFYSTYTVQDYRNEHNNCLCGVNLNIEKAGNYYNIN